MDVVENVMMVGVMTHCRALKPMLRTTAINFPSVYLPHNWWMLKHTSCRDLWICMPAGRDLSSWELQWNTKKAPNQHMKGWVLNAGEIYRFGPICCMWVSGSNSCTHPFHVAGLSKQAINFGSKSNSFHLPAEPPASPLSPVFPFSAKGRVVLLRRCRLSSFIDQPTWCIKALSSCCWLFGALITRLSLAVRPADAQRSDLSPTKQALPQHKNLHTIKSIQSREAFQVVTSTADNVAGAL